MLYKVVIEVEIAAKNKSELDYILIETYAANEADKVTITNQSGINIPFKKSVKAKCQRCGELHPALTLYTIKGKKTCQKCSKEANNQ